MLVRASNKSQASTQKKDDGFPWRNTSDERSVEESETENETTDDGEVDDREVEEELIRSCHDLRDLRDAAERL